MPFKTIYTESENYVPGFGFINKKREQMHIREARAVIARKLERLEKERRAIDAMLETTNPAIVSFIETVADIDKQRKVWKEALRNVDQYIEENQIP